jgi:MoxR-like ATPase
VVKAIVNNKFCPDEIKKRYILYALDKRLRTYLSQLGPSGPDILDAMRKSLEAWQPVQKLAPVPDLDREDTEAMQLYDIAQRKGAIILYGPPGTSKTRLALMIARALTDGDDYRTEFVQFHASYTYEDFIEGIVPKPQGAIALSTRSRRRFSKPSVSEPWNSRVSALLS